MEFSSPVYELLYLYEKNGVKFPPYLDLMKEEDILKILSSGIGERRGRKL
jgi:hypothetical protein